MTQGERIKEIRKSLGMTLEKFGEKLGVKKAAISALENNSRNLTDQMAKSICREYNVNYDYIMNGTGKMFSDFPQTVLEELCVQYDLDWLDKQIVEMYITLPKQLRDSVKEHIKKTYFNGANKKKASDDKPVVIRAAHLNPGATPEQIAADDAIMEDDNF
ncbi:MAG: helix-turn-helix transcriptional regulator [Anaerovoracaceae bacterium]|nr:helix-turn-helix transcriptional regulator [Anaerovoracaceae bacterium]